jgi:hypothetical protein
MPEPFVTVERRPDGAAEQETAAAVARTEAAARGMASVAAHGPGQATFVGR